MSKKEITKKGLEQLRKKIDYKDFALSKPRRKKRKKKSNLQKRKENDNSTYWRHKADREWYRVQHEIWESRCAICGKLGEIHHLIPKSTRTYSVRHAKKNGMCLCADHHKWNPVISAHGSPIGFSLWLQETYPELHDWVLENRWKLKQPYNFREAYLRLIKKKELEK